LKEGVDTTLSPIFWQLHRWCWGGAHLAHQKAQQHRQSFITFTTAILVNDHTMETSIGVAVASFPSFLPRMERSANAVFNINRKYMRTVC
jgi:hypothetical protein